MHEHAVQGGIVVAVAGPPHPTEVSDEPWHGSIGSGSRGNIPPV
jgi:hypothetical protein